MELTGCTGAQAMAPYKVLRTYYLAFLARPTIILLFVSVIAHSAGIFDAFVPNLAFYSLLGLCVSLGIGFTLCIVNDRPVTALAGMGLIAFYLFQHLVFSFHAHVAPNINAIISYLPVVSFVLIAQRVVSLHATLRLLAWLSLGYCMVYVLLHGYFLGMKPADNPALLVGDDVRGTRLRLVLELASYCVIYATTGKDMRWIGRALMIGFGVAALWLSGSRTFGALFLGIYLLTALRMLGIGTRALLFAVFMGISIAFLLGLFLPWNPMELFAGDNSAIARASEYRYAIDALREHCVLGVGLWTDFATLQNYLKTPQYWPLYPSDLGILGPYLVFGLFGMLAYVAATYLCIVPRLPQLRSPGLRALRINCIICGSYGIISPAIALESQSFFLALLVGALLRVRRRPLIQPRETMHF